jgi:hypothetical protein
LDYDSTADTLLVGTQGRGAWVLKDVSLLLAPEPGMMSCGLFAGLLMMIRRRSTK